MQNSKRVLKKVVLYTNSIDLGACEKPNQKHLDVSLLIE